MSIVKLYVDTKRTVPGDNVGNLKFIVKNQKIMVVLSLVGRTIWLYSTQSRYLRKPQVL